MGNPTYTPPERQAEPEGQPVVIAGLQWRLDANEKVLLFGRDPLGSVARNVRQGCKRFPFCAVRQPGGYRSEKFVTEGEAIGFVEASIPAYLEHIAYRAVHPSEGLPWLHIQSHL